jgi:hypothetical protein
LSTAGVVERTMEDIYDRGRKKDGKASII